MNMASACWGKWGNRRNGPKPIPADRNGLNPCPPLPHTPTDSGYETEGHWFESSRAHR